MSTIPSNPLIDDTDKFLQQIENNPIGTEIKSKPVPADITNLPVAPGDFSRDSLWQESRDTLTKAPSMRGDISTGIQEAIKPVLPHTARDIGSFIAGDNDLGFGLLDAIGGPSAVALAADDADRAAAEGAGPIERGLMSAAIPLAAAPIVGSIGAPAAKAAGRTVDFFLQSVRNLEKLAAHKPMAPIEDITKAFANLRSNVSKQEAKDTNLDNEWAAIVKDYKNNYGNEPVNVMELAEELKTATTPNVRVGHSTSQYKGAADPEYATKPTREAEEFINIDNVEDTRANWENTLSVLRTELEYHRTNNLELPEHLQDLPTRIDELEQALGAAEIRANVDNWVPEGVTPGAGHNGGPPLDDKVVASNYRATMLHEPNKTFGKDYTHFQREPYTYQESLERGDTISDTSPLKIDPATASAHSRQYDLEIPGEGKGINLIELQSDRRAVEVSHAHRVKKTQEALDIVNKEASGETLTRDDWEKLINTQDSFAIPGGNTQRRKQFLEEELVRLKNRVPVSAMHGDRYPQALIGQAVKEAIERDLDFVAIPTGAFVQTYEGIRGPKAVNTYDKHGKDTLEKIAGMAAPKGINQGEFAKTLVKKVSVGESDELKFKPGLVTEADNGATRTNFDQTRSAVIEVIKRNNTMQELDLANATAGRLINAIWSQHYSGITKQFVERLVATNQNIPKAQHDAVVNAIKSTMFDAPQQELYLLKLTPEAKQSISEKGLPWFLSLMGLAGGASQLDMETQEQGNGI